MSLTTSETDKEVRLNKMKGVMKQRRVSVTRLFKQLGDMGVRYHRGNNLWTDDFFIKDNQKCTIDAETLQFTEATRKQFTSLWQGSEKYYYRSLNRMQLLLDRLTMPHQDLSPDLIKRMRGACKHLMLLSTDLRHQSTLLARNLSILTCVVDDLKQAPQRPVASASSLFSVCDKIHSFGLSLSLSAAEVCAVIDTRPETESLLAGDDVRKTPSQLQLMEARDLLTTIKGTCRNIAQRSSHMCVHFSGISWSRLVNESHVHAVSDMHRELCDVSTSLRKAVTLMDSEAFGHTCLTRQLVSWVSSWACATKEVETWLRCADQRLSHVSQEGSKLSLAELENCTRALLYAIQCLYKKYTEAPTTEDESPSDDIISNTMVSSLLADLKSLKLNYILKCLTSLVSEVSDSCSHEALNNLVQIQSLLSQYSCLGDNLLLAAAAAGRSLGKLFSVLLAIFYQMANKGFCKPQDLQDEGGAEGKLSFEDEDDSEAAGLAEGEGKKDMSDKLESEDQLESALQEGQKENPGDKDLKEENGVEMSEDFEGKLQDMERPELDEENEEDDKADESKMDDQMGETEQGAEVLDKKLWNDKEEGKEGDEELEEDDSAEAGDDERESQIVAKDKHQKRNNDKKDEGKDAQEKKDKPEEMEEDRREPNKLTEEDDEDDDGNFDDRLAGEEKKPQDQPEDDGKDIPDDLNLDEAEEERPGDDEAKDDKDGDDEENPMEIEKKGLFPEGKDVDEKKENEKESEKEDEDMEHVPEEESLDTGEEDKGEKNVDDMENTDKDFQADEVDEENANDGDDTVDKEHKKNAGRLEEEDGQEDKQEKNAEEDVEASKDHDTRNNAEAAPVDTKDASKDKTKEAPKTEDSGQDRDDDEEQQEEMGEAGEKTKESLGVGQSDTQPQDEEMHQGEQSAVTRDSKQSKENEEQQEKPKKDRKPGDVDERKVTGDPDKKLRQGLMTSERKRLQQDMEPEPGTPDNCDNDEAVPEDEESPLMRTIKKAEEESEGQAVDAGTRDQAIEAPAPVQEDEAPQPEEEGVQQHLMDVDDKEDEEDLQDCEKLDPEKQKGRGREHRQGQEGDGGDDDDNKDEKMETEGEFVLEHTVQRPPETYFHTLLEQEELTAEAQVEEDVSATCARLQESRLGLQRPTDEACQAWAANQAQVAPYAAQLSDQLRLILEPTEKSRLKGDYKTGKRLNMRKVIGYIASHFLKDKIWLRRTQPCKRAYHVLVAVDDSESMKAVHAEELAQQSISLVTQALTKLEVGKVGVVSFGSSTTLLHSLEDAFSDASGAKVFANLKFEQQESRFVDLLESSVALFRDARGGAVAHSDTAQILLIISDGQTHARSEALRAAVRAARNDRIFVVFFVLDASENHSFYDIKVWDNVNFTLKPLAEEFPFPFYLVVRDLTTLPHVLAEALRRWFELVTADAAQ